MNNHELCGKPFADAEWIPTLDICDKKCDEISELCVENDSLVQKCKKLPEDCSKQLKSSNHCHRLVMENAFLKDDEKLHVKWRHQSRWRRFAIPKTGINYKFLFEFLRSVEPSFNGKLDYVDDEGDFVRISSTSGINELIRTCELMKLDTVYVHSTDESMC
uniref:PB1 domain-containing protein n=1 Tax=Panagrolaimus sp. JU765 TaxID=591449 RepID=A0AC34QI76_9BILA